MSDEEGISPACAALQDIGVYRLTSDDALKVLNLRVHLPTVKWTATAKEIDLYPDEIIIILLIGIFKYDKYKYHVSLSNQFAPSALAPPCHWPVEAQVMGMWWSWAHTINWVLAF